MKKIKSLFLSLIVFSFFLPLSNAQVSSDFNLTQTHDWLTIVMDSDSGVELDFNLDIKPQPNENIKPNVKGISALKPVLKLHIGRDISPKISDEGRVKGILALIGKIVRNEQLQFSSDGQTFGNREKRLPIKDYGFYKEYTFIPPKNSPKVIMIGDVEYKIGPSYSYRGPERLIIGGNEIVYYTPDHYAKFVRLEIIR
ncbi:MAG: ribonuclease domain-containing protein [Elusimicrobiota bacterium]|nr:ribonuclease domain-containing protein [Elusimicrobiota bacterium]